MKELNLSSPTQLISKTTDLQSAVENITDNNFGLSGGT